MVLTRFYAKSDGESDSEYLCYYLDSTRVLDDRERQVLFSILNLNLSNEESLEVLKLHEQSQFIEVGPKLEYMTPWCSQALMVLKRCNVDIINRIEMTLLFDCKVTNPSMDPMTHMIYNKPLVGFGLSRSPERSFEVSTNDLEKFNNSEKLGFDDFDMNLYRKIWSKQSKSKENVSNTLNEDDSTDDSVGNEKTTLDNFYPGTLRSEYLSTQSSLQTINFDIDDKDSDLTFSNVKDAFATNQSLNSESKVYDKVADLSRYNTKQINNHQKIPENLRQANRSDNKSEESSNSKPLPSIPSKPNSSKPLPKLPEKDIQPVYGPSPILPEKPNKSSKLGLSIFKKKSKRSKKKRRKSDHQNTTVEDNKRNHIYQDLILTPPSSRREVHHKRIPSDVELYDLSQSNSEHSRHWLFRGELVLDGNPLPYSLMDLIKMPIEKLQKDKLKRGQRDNSLIAMKDNSSAIRGYRINYFQPIMREYQIIRKLVHPIFTAETHNFPTGIAPFPGAATGTGGRIRDIQAMGRGGLMIAGTAGYCVGNLRLPDDDLSKIWENYNNDYPLHLPSRILIEASNGASDYGNKIGEPLIQGFCRSFGMHCNTYSDIKKRLEWVKPMMFTGGIGQVMDEHVNKLDAQEGWLIVRLGGPAYRIGIGGGALSSRSQGELNTDGSPFNENKPQCRETTLPRRSNISPFAQGEPMVLGEEKKNKDFNGDSNSINNRLYNELKGELENRSKSCVSGNDIKEGTSNSNNTNEVLDDTWSRVLQLEKSDKLRRSNSKSKFNFNSNSCNSNSSTEQDTYMQKVSNADFNAVQRDDPEMENRLNRVIRTCIEMGVNNPILSIHDQGAGGMANVTKEIVSPKGGLVSLGNVHCGDSTLSAREKWIGEYQEQNTILIHPKDSMLLKDICKRENCPYQFVGFVSQTGRIQVYDPKGNSRKIVEMNPVDMDLNEVLENIPNKRFNLNTSKRNQIQPKSLPVLRLSIDQYLERVFRLVSVGSKRFLINKVDRSVGGLVAQQQCVGPLHTPIADVAVVAQSMFGKTGIATSVSEQSIKGLLDPVKMARITVGEMLTNLIWSPITKLSDVKCSGNWMWEKKFDDEIYALYQAVQSLSNIMQQLGIAIDGGKDSLSMSARVNGEDVLCPRSLVLSSYVTCPDITKIVTPDFKMAGNYIIFVDLGIGKTRMGGSSLAQTLGDSILGNKVPDLDNVETFVAIFRIIQCMIMDGLIESGHDRSDGGLITTICEMAIAGNIGFELDLSKIMELQMNRRKLDGAEKLEDPNHIFHDQLVRLLFNEELGLVIEIGPHNLDVVLSELRNILPDVYVIGKTVRNPVCRIKNCSESILDEKLNRIREMWESTSYRLEKMQCNVNCVDQEMDFLTSVDINERLPKTILPEDVRAMMDQICDNEIKHKVAILREEGSNGDREMAMAFKIAGFQAIDVTVQDLLNGLVDLSEFRGIAFVGGFSFADVLGAGRAWYWSLMSSSNVVKQLEEFKSRPDTFSLGICNGCQLMAELEWIPGKFVKNKSIRFESRFSTVKVLKSNSIMLKDMEGMQMGIWIAHGEGRYDPSDLSNRKYKKLNKSKIDKGGTCLAYVDGNGRPTETYPLNPNGSPDGITGLCSEDGRHLAMMPHPERCIFKWQVPHINDELEDRLGNVEHYPWIEMFKNAKRWCLEYDEFN